MCLVASGRCAASTGLAEKRNGNLTTLLNLFLVHGVVTLADLVKERLQDHGGAPYFSSVHLSVPESRLVAGGYAPCKENYVED